MKRIFAVLLSALIVTTVSITTCGQEKDPEAEAARAEEREFVEQKADAFRGRFEIYSVSFADIGESNEYIYADKQNGVCYLVITGPHGAAATVMVNADGTPLTIDDILTEDKEKTENEIQSR